jgi:hypothetical protein
MVGLRRVSRAGCEEYAGNDKLLQGSFVFLTRVKIARKNGDFACVSPCGELLFTPPALGGTIRPAIDPLRPFPRS